MWRAAPGWSVSSKQKHVGTVGAARGRTGADGGELEEYGGHLLLTGTVRLLDSGLGCLALLAYCMADDASIVAIPMRTLYSVPPPVWINNTTGEAR